jgi:orotidine-5'-phosphate decarboxylase
MSAQVKLSRNLTELGPLCIGLDPDLQRLPAACRGDTGVFLREIIAATAEVASAYKLNIAFFESQGADGFRVLESVRAAIPERALLIWDAKRGDIENTNEHYARSAFSVFKADAVTVHPYLGLEPLRPFFAYRDRLTFVLCATSEGTTLQDLHVKMTSDKQGRHGGEVDLGEPLALWVAREVARLNEGQCGLVVGATNLSRLRAVRAIAKGVPLLVPGVGAQGGEIPAQPALINASRSILYASSGADFADAAAKAAQALRAACLRAADFSGKDDNPGITHE